MGKLRPHVNAHVFMIAWVIEVFGVEFMNPEAPIDVAPEDNPTNEPVPDLIVLKRPSRDFPNANPQPEDLALVVEVSNTTYYFDSGVKARLYARAGIEDFWIIDVPRQRIIVHREPGGDGYRSITAYGIGEGVEPLARPGAALQVSHIFPGRLK